MYQLIRFMSEHHGIEITEEEGFKIVELVRLMDEQFRNNNRNFLEPEELVSIFNQLYPVGATVLWRGWGVEGEPFLAYTVKSPAFVRHGQALVFFNEKSACCSIDPGFVHYATSELKKVY